MNGRPCSIEDVTLTVLTRVSAWLPGALLLFFVAAFALPREPAYALVFYVAVLPCLAARLVAGPGPRVTPSAAMALGLIGFSALTLVWGVDDGGRTWRFAGSAAATLGFVLAMLTVMGDTAWRARLEAVLVAGGGLNAAWSIAYALVTHPRNPRLHGWGVTSHPILGATVMAVAGLTALSWTLAPPALGMSRRRRGLALLAALVMAAFILLTESRGPLLATSIAVLFLCAVSVWRVRAFGALAVFVAVWFALPKAARDHGEAVLVARGSSHRLEIWRYTLGLIRDRPVFGHGLAANLHLNVGDDITFPHDMYLSLLFYSGLAGLLIFAGLAGLLTWRLWRGRGEAEWAWLAALWINMLVSGLTDIGQITKGPGPVWFIVWLPVGLLLTWRGVWDAPGHATPMPASGHERHIVMAEE
jgi:O-antigen ligase